MSEVVGTIARAVVSLVLLGLVGWLFWDRWSATARGFVREWKESKAARDARKDEKR